MKRTISANSQQRMLTKAGAILTKYITATKSKMFIISYLMKHLSDITKSRQETIER